MKQFLVQQIFATIFALSNKFQKVSNTLSGNMTLRQFMFLLAIEHIPPGECTYNRVAQKLDTTKQNVKQLADSLLKKQFIAIDPNVADKRAVNISMTQSGQKNALEYAGQSQLFLDSAAENFTTEV